MTTLYYHPCKKKILPYRCNEHQHYTLEKEIEHLKYLRDEVFGDEARRRIDKIVRKLELKK